MRHSYPWYPADWRMSRAFSTMTLEQQGAYRNLLDMYYRQGRLPLDEEELRMYSGANPREWKRVWPVVSLWFAKQSDWLVNAKADEIYKKLENWQQKRREGAKKTNELRSGIAPSVATVASTTTTTTTSTTTPSSSSALSPKGESANARASEPTRIDPFYKRGPSQEWQQREKIARELYAYLDSAHVVLDPDGSNRVQDVNGNSAAGTRLLDLFKVSVNPEIEAGAIKRKHKAIIEHWTQHGGGKTLFYWILDGDYMRDPPKPKAPKPERDVLERVRAGR